jgi:pyruvate-formate lyase-activating enzyme
MVKFKSLEPLADPANPISFLLDWELTMKCNLDCTYCGTGLYAGHDNSTQHPPLDECLRTVDFMYEYADLYLARKTASLRKVVLNVYGGESLHHPNIVTILEAAHEQHKKYSWPLTITTTTNAIVTPAKLSQVLPFIDHWTVSYHTECTTKQKQQFKDNLLAIKAAGKSIKCVVLMHSEPDLFADAENMITWLKNNNIEISPRALDHPKEWDQFNYSSQQIKWFNKLHNNDLVAVEESTDLSDVGRACCGGRSLCQNSNYKTKLGFVSNKFTGWSCSVNWFFLYVKQVNGEVYTNKDCMMNFEGGVGPIGNLSDCNSVLTKLKYQLDTGTLPVIACAKASCWCGLCAPKAQTRSMYDSMIEKYQTSYIPEEQL